MIILYVFTSTIFIVLFIQIFRLVQKRTKLILIEGLDCSGKKSTAKELKKILVEKGYNCRINNGALVKSPISYLSNLFTYHWNSPSQIRSLVYALKYIIDAFFYIPLGKQVILQVTYFYRSKSYNKTLNKRFFYLINILSQPFYVKFHKIIYLDTSFNTRIDRHKQDEKEGNTFQTLKERFLLDTPYLYKKWEKNILEDLRKSKAFTKSVRTDKTSVEDTARKVYNIIKDIL